MTDLTEDQQRDRLLFAALPHVPFDGWGKGALKMAAEDLDISVHLAEGLFPDPARDMISRYSAQIDRLMTEALAADGDFDALKIRERIAKAVRLRLQLVENDKEAVRRGTGFLALPGNSALGLKLLYQTVDHIWYMAGDRSTDWNFYSKRMLLGAVYSSTLLYWLADSSEDHAESWAFLERRIDNVMQIPRIKSRLGACFGFFPRRIQAMRVFKSGPA